MCTASYILHAILLCTTLYTLHTIYISEYIADRGGGVVDIIRPRLAHPSPRSVHARASPKPLRQPPRAGFRWLGRPKL